VSGSFKKGAGGYESATLLLLKDMGHVKDLNLICLMLLEVNPKLKIIGADYIGEPQSKELSRAAPRVSSALSFIRGSSHRRKSAVCSKFDMVWLNLSPIPLGRRRGVISSFE
jgi:hypothetical protein